jgi:hypothetical protein
MKATCGSIALLTSLVIAPSLAFAQTPDSAATPSANPAVEEAWSPRPGVAPAPAQALSLPQAVAPEDQVIQYNLSGPRIGATFAPNGSATSQFGWHTEHQASPGNRGPWFIVEKIFLIGGLEANRFMPSGTLVFGIRMPNSFEFGVGPSATLGGYQFFNTAIVVAAGQSFRAGGIRIPVNVAMAINRFGENRYTLMTGWAIKDSFVSH